MCNFLSGLVLRNGDILTHPMLDGHADLVTHFNLPDTDAYVQHFAKVELRPVDWGDVATWEWHLDEQAAPSWWDDVAGGAEAELRARAARMILREGEHRLIVDGSWIVLGTAVVRDVRAGRILHVQDSAQIHDVQDSAQIHDVRDSAQIHDVWGHAQIHGVWGHAQIHDVEDSAQIHDVRDSARIHGVWGRAQIRGVQDSAQIHDVWGHARIHGVWGHAQIHDVWGRAQIHGVQDSAQIYGVEDSAQIYGVGGRAQLDASAKAHVVKTDA